MTSRRMILVCATAFGLLIALSVILSYASDAAVHANQPGRTPLPIKLREATAAPEVCRTYASSNVPIFIPDNTSPGPSSRLSIPNNNYITAISVTMTISHTWPRDLVISLCPPKGSSCVLEWGDLTSVSGVYTVTFSSDYSKEYWQLREDGYTYSGSYQDYGTYYGDPDLYLGLVNLIGRRAGGVWRLNVEDESSSDVGYLTAWNMELCTTATVPTATPTATLAPTYTPIPWTPDPPMVTPGVYVFEAGDVSIYGDECVWLVQNKPYWTADEWNQVTSDTTSGYPQLFFCNMCSNPVTLDLALQGYAKGHSQSLQQYFTKYAGGTPAADETFYPTETNGGDALCLGGYSSIAEQSSQLTLNTHYGNWDAAHNWDYSLPIHQTSYQLYQFSGSLSYGACIAQSNHYFKYSVEGNCNPFPTITPWPTPTPSNIWPTPTAICGTPIPAGWGGWWSW